MFRKIIPLEKIIYHSALKKEDLLIHLQSEIESEKSFGLNSYRHSYSKPYIGKIYNDSFEIKRAINYRNSFLPIIKGRIENHITGSKIHVKMGLVEIVKIFMTFWFGAVLLACAAVTYSVINSDINGEHGFFIFIPFVMLIGGILMVIFGFKIESKKSIVDLENVLKARIIKR